MPLGLFIVAAALSAGSSVVLVSRLERVGERLGLVEALLGLIVALAADGPEITSALTAVATGQREIGVGVALGSNAFNLAAMLGLSVLAAGGLHLPRFATMLEGSIAILIGVIAVAVVMVWIAPVLGLLLGLGVFLPYVFVCAVRPETRARLPLPRPWLTWLRRADRPGEGDHPAGPAGQPRRRRGGRDGGSRRHRRERRHGADGDDDRGPGGRPHDRGRRSHPGRHHELAQCGGGDLPHASRPRRGRDERSVPQQRLQRRSLPCSSPPSSSVWARRRAAWRWPPARTSASPPRPSCSPSRGGGWVGRPASSSSLATWGTRRWSS